MYTSEATTDLVLPSDLTAVDPSGSCTMIATIYQPAGEFDYDQCVDSAGDATDSGGDHCGWYGSNTSSCGSYNDDDFDACNMCCECLNDANNDCEASPVYFTDFQYPNRDEAECCTYATNGNFVEMQDACRSKWEFTWYTDDEYPSWADSQSVADGGFCNLQIQPLALDDSDFGTATTENPVEAENCCLTGLGDPLDSNDDDVDLIGGCEQMYVNYAYDEGLS